MKDYNIHEAVDRIVSEQIYGHGTVPPPVEPVKQPTPPPARAAMPLSPAWDEVQKISRAYEAREAQAHRRGLWWLVAGLALNAIVYVTHVVPEAIFIGAEIAVIIGYLIFHEGV